MRRQSSWICLALIYFAVGSADAAEIGADGFVDSDGVKIVTVHTPDVADKYSEQSIPKTQ
jgi:hypothetical protein